MTAPTPLPPTPVLLGTQLLFNVGFYAVVPFLALVLADDFALSAAAVGLVLGVRTFSQQGMFLVGGGLADRFGARPVMLTGCLVRVVGFTTLAASLVGPAPQLPLFVAGTVLTGLGGALFSPGLNVLVAEAETRRSSERSSGGRRSETRRSEARRNDGRPGDERRTEPDPRSRASLFAWVSVSGEIGAVLGPLAGAALLGWGFVAVTLSGAGFFLAIWVFLALALPRTHARVRRRGDGRWWSTRDGRFVGFSALHAADLLAYNQLYLALPLALMRTPDAAAATAVMFAGVSVLTLVLQVPLSRWAARVGAPRALRLGYTLSAVGFLVVAAAASSAVADVVVVASVFAAAGMIVVGHMLAHPTVLSMIPRLAGDHPTGSFYGLLATCGGIAVLVGNPVVGGLLGWQEIPAAAWVVLAVPLVVAAVACPRLIAMPAPVSRR